MKILLINEWYNIVTQNLIFYLASILGPSQFQWTGKRWYRKDYLPFHELEELSLLSEPDAFTKLQNGEYDFVLYSEGTTSLYLSSHLKQKNTKRVVLDCSDSDIIPRYYWENADIYFKSQLSKKGIFIQNKSDNKPIKINKATSPKYSHLYPLPLTPSFKVSSTKIFDDVSTKNHDVFFAGSAWPQDRAKLISIVQSCPEINFFGGLHNRGDLEFNCVVPDSLKFKRMNFADYFYSVRSSKINLNIIGNGKNCFRQYEIMCLGGTLLTQKHNNYWGHIEPENEKHCIFYKEDGSDLIDIIKYYLKYEEKAKQIAKNGQDFFNKNYHPNILAQRIINILSKHQ